MATQPAEHVRDMDRLEKMFNRGMLLIGLLATLGIGSGFFTYWSFSEKIEGIAEKAQAKLESISTKTEKDLQEAVATARGELLDDLKDKINVEQIANQAKTESVSLITEKLRTEFDSNISET
jgi:hypothetical protein